jgi:uncharacterized protein
VQQLATARISPSYDSRAYFRDVFAWMAVALAVTGAVAAAIGHNGTALHTLLEGGGFSIFVVLAVIELLLVGVLVRYVQHMGLVEAAATFLGFAALNGVTLSVIFAVYTTKSIFSTFLVCGAMFGVLALVGATTKVDLTHWGSFLFMALVGQGIGLLVNFFWLDSTLYWVTTASGVVLFSAYTAYDVQKLEQYDPVDADEATIEKSAIVGALALYLDFVNLYLYLLRLFGRRR